VPFCRLKLARTAQKMSPTSLCWSQQVAQQIRSAQQKAALAGQAPAAWAIGAKCQAVYSLDGEWYEASVVGVTTAGDFVVNFAAYGNTEQVLLSRFAILR